MLDVKSKQLAAKDADLKRREALFNRQKVEAARELEALYQKKLSET